MHYHRSIKIVSYNQNQELMNFYPNGNKFWTYYNNTSKNGIMMQYELDTGQNNKTTRPAKITYL